MKGEGEEKGEREEEEGQGEGLGHESRTLGGERSARSSLVMGFGWAHVAPSGAGVI